MAVSRRTFLGASGVVMGAGLPAVFQRATFAAPKIDQPGSADTILVVLQLSGGNDGLNTVIPFRDRLYQAARPTLKQSASKVLKIDRDLAFHPAMTGLEQLWNDKTLAVVQGVGYANPNRSHFESMDIWHKATRSRAEQFGWLGRCSEKLPQGVFIGRGEGPLAMFSASGHASAVDSLAEYRLKTGGGKAGVARRELIENLSQQGDSDGDLLSFMRSSTQKTYDSSRELERVANRYKSSAEYPKSRLGNHLQLIAQLIDAGIPERIYYTDHGGFDTHAGQQETHAKLLKDFSDSLAAFQKDIAEKGHAKRVLVMTFSEFGRRVKENGSEGTDHGVASQMFLIGERVQPGFLGDHPSLDDLTDGDLKHHTDFRQVYATVLDQWLKVPSQDVLGKSHEPIKAIQPMG